MAKTCTHCGSALPEFGGIICDADKREVHFRGKTVSSLTPIQFLFFQALLRAKGRTLSNEKLIEEIYSSRIMADAEVPDANIISVYAFKIRKKLAPLKLNIRALYGAGYYLEAPK